MNEYVVIPIAAGILAFIFYSIGYFTHHQPTYGEYMDEIRAFVEKEYPQEWASYTKGVSEGYAQGLRDCQENPDEPA